MFIHTTRGVFMMVAVIMLMDMLVMIAEVYLTKLGAVVGVHEQTRKGTSGHCGSQTERRSERKHGNHAPYEGDVASAHSFQLRHHRHFGPNLSVTLASLAASFASDKPQAPTGSGTGRNNGEKSLPGALWRLGL